MRLGVYAYVAAGESLLLTQLNDGEPDAGSWTLPGGGVAWGEHPLETLHRELYEETGLEGVVVELLGISSRVFPQHEETGHPALHAIRMVYRVSAAGKPRVVEVGGSTSAVGWFRFDELSGRPMVDLVEFAMERAGDRP